MRRLPLLSAAIILAAWCASAPGSSAQEALPFDLSEFRLVGLIQNDEGRSKIFGGKDVEPPDRYPFQVALINNRARPGQEWPGQFCGGSLIAEKWVLTAAHCMFSINPSTGEKFPLGPKNIDIYAGSTDFSGGDRIRAKKLITHQRYDAPGHSNDIALVELERAPEQGWKPATIDYASAAADRSLSAPDKTVTVIGWGRTEDGSYPKNLREVDLPIVANDVCDAAIKDHLIARAIKRLDQSAEEQDMSDEEYQAQLAVIRSTKSKVNATMVCAGLDEGKKDACDGDSGGPLFTRTAGGTFAQVGIVSWGMGCGLPKVRGLYARVSEYKGWIDQNIGAAQ